MSLARNPLVIFIIFLIALSGGIFLYYFSEKPVGREWEISFSQPKEPAPENKKERKEEIEMEDIFREAQTLSSKAEVLILEIQQFIEEKKREAQERSLGVKGVYLTEFTANSPGPEALQLREDIKKLLAETELRGVVIDVKEVRGPSLPNSLKNLIQELREEDIWLIARICVFRDASLFEEKPDWYIRATGTSDYWLDPKNPAVRDYIVDFSKKVINFGFDELQFDYIRYPSDPFYETDYSKSEVIHQVFVELSRALREYKPSIILSVDLFGYVATELQALDIGQRLEDAAEVFDYLSFMLYPSHFYSGFEVGDFYLKPEEVSEYPYEIVYKSIEFANNYLSSWGSSAKIRPWLQDFDLKADTDLGVFYDAEKVRLQIEAAQEAGASGWLLWNPTNIYTTEALK